METEAKLKWLMVLLLPSGHGLYKHVFQKNEPYLKMEELQKMMTPNVAKMRKKRISQMKKWKCFALSTSALSPRKWDTKWIYNLNPPLPPPALA